MALGYAPAVAVEDPGADGDDELDGEAPPSPTMQPKKMGKCQDVDVSFLTKNKQEAQEAAQRAGDTSRCQFCGDRIGGCKFRAAREAVLRGTERNATASSVDANLALPALYH